MPKLKFPKPDEVKPANPCAFRSLAIAIQLYNQETGEEAERLSKKVQDWYKAQAEKKGWSRVYFPRDYPTANYAGIVFVLFSKHAVVGQSKKKVSRRRQPARKARP